MQAENAQEKLRVKEEIQKIIDIKK